MNKTLDFILFAYCKGYHPLEEAIQQCKTFCLKNQKSENIHLYISAPYAFVKTLKEKLHSYCVEETTTETQEKQSPTTTAPRIILGGDELLPVDDKTFTAAIANKLLIQAGAKFVVIGTPNERVFSKTKGHSLESKLKATLKSELVPFVCLTETTQEHEDGLTKQTLTEQLKVLIEKIPPEELRGLHILYDAPWINDGLWKITDPLLTNAYQMFKEAVDEVVDPSIRDTLHLVAPVSSTLELTEEVTTLFQSPPYSFAGYSIGSLPMKLSH
ncbi:MAG: triose-phosphate isomerase [Parachlamydiaceae bacterium]